MSERAADSAPKDTQRIDQWLWFARIVKSRTLGQALVERGKVRVNRLRIDKASTAVKAGDVLTMSMGPRVRVFEVVGIGVRRGPAIEAQQLYREIIEAPATTVRGPKADVLQPEHLGLRDPGAGRPTKRDRRLTEKLKGR